MPPSVPTPWSPTYRPGGSARIRSIQGPVTPDTVHSSAAGLIDSSEMSRIDSSVETEEADEPSAMHGSSGACIGPPQGMSIVTILSSSSTTSTSGATRCLSVMEYGYGSGGGTRCLPPTKVASTRNLLFATSTRPLRSLHCFAAPSTALYASCRYSFDSASMLQPRHRRRGKG